MPKSTNWDNDSATSSNGKSNAMPLATGCAASDPSPALPASGEGVAASGWCSTMPGLRYGGSPALFYFALFLLTVSAAAWQGYTVNGSEFAGLASHQLFSRRVAIDVDNVLLLNSLRAHPTLVSTLGWLHESWCGHRVPYYWRPLTMFAFWIENAACGQHRAGWVDVSIGLHAAFTVLLALFAGQVARGSDRTSPMTALPARSFVAAILTVLIFTEVLPPIRFLNADFALSGANVVLDNWKDQLETWTGMAILASLMFSLDGRWKPALVCVAAAICCKESGWLAFIGPLLIVITRPVRAGAERQGRTLRRPTGVRAGAKRRGRTLRPPQGVRLRAAASWIATAAVLVALRASSGWEVFRAPSASSGHIEIWHTLHAVIDNYTAMLGSDLWPIPLLGAAYGTIAVARGLHARARLGLCGVATLLAVSALMLISHASAAIAALVILDPSTGLHATLMCVGYAIVVILALREPDFWRSAAFLYLLVLITASPSLVVSQPNMHMYYLTNGIQCVLIASFLAAAAGTAIRTWRPTASHLRVALPAIH
ncbi:MAG: hypothetical protein ACLQVD_08085 [Capsulimonadaceae bacterium]